MTNKYHNIPTAIAVADEPGSSSYGTLDTNDGKVFVEGEWSKGQVQPPAYRDAGFGILFWAQFLTVVVLGVLFATGVLEVEFDEIHGSRFLTQTQEESAVDLSALGWAVGTSILAAPAFTVLAFSFMSRNAVLLIQASIYVAIGINVFLAVLCVILHAYLATIAPALMAFFTFLYAKYVWHRIPYAGKWVAT
jgi:hypothetical protein